MEKLVKPLWVNLYLAGFSLLEPLCGGARTVRPRRRPRSAVEVDWHRVTGGGARSSIVLGLGKHLRHVRENRGESVESILNSKSNATAIRARVRKLERCCHVPEIFLQTFSCVAHGFTKD